MLAVHMDQALGPCPFVQVINILGDDHQITRPSRIEPRERIMRGIGLRALDRLTPHIIKAQHQIRITREGFGRCDILNPVFFPQAVFGAKCIDPAFGADPSASEDDDIANAAHRAHEAQVIR